MYCITVHKNNPLHKVMMTDRQTDTLLSPWRELAWGLSALLHAKTDSQRSERMRSLADPIVMKVVSASAVECVKAWTWYVEVLVIHCSLEVSSRNRSSCHWIQTHHLTPPPPPPPFHQAESVGLPHVQRLSHYQAFPHRSVLTQTFTDTICLSEKVWSCLPRLADSSHSGRGKQEKQQKKLILDVLQSIWEKEKVPGDFHDALI